jgi:hypothetical protein
MSNEFEYTYDRAQIYKDVCIRYNWIYTLTSLRVLNKVQPWWDWIRTKESESWYGL